MPTVLDFRVRNSRIPKIASAIKNAAIISLFSVTVAIALSIYLLTDATILLFVAAAAAAAILLLLDDDIFILVKNKCTNT